MQHARKAGPGVGEACSARLFADYSVRFNYQRFVQSPAAQHPAIVDMVAGLRLDIDFRDGYSVLLPQAGTCVKLLSHVGRIDPSLRRLSSCNANSPNRSMLCEGCSADSSRRRTNIFKLPCTRLLTKSSQAEVHWQQRTLTTIGREAEDKAATCSEKPLQSFGVVRLRGMLGLLCRTFNHPLVRSLACCVRSTRRHADCLQSVRART